MRKDECIRNNHAAVLSARELHDDVTAIRQHLQSVGPFTPGQSTPFAESEFEVANLLRELASAQAQEHVSNAGPQFIQRVARRTDVVPTAPAVEIRLCPTR
jgi:hypothetical protein